MILNSSKVHMSASGQFIDSCFSDSSRLLSVQPYPEAQRRRSVQVGLVLDSVHNCRHASKTGSGDREERE